MEIMAGISKLQRLVNASLTEAHTDQEEERLTEMQRILRELAKTYSTNLSDNKIERYFFNDIGYITPKVDVRAVVFNQLGELLLVQKKQNGTWVLPGGQTQVGYAPSEVAYQETLRDVGLKVKPKNIVKILDQSEHHNPIKVEHVYQFFIYCQPLTFKVDFGTNILDAHFFRKEEINPSLNLDVGKHPFQDIMDLFTGYQTDWKQAPFL